MYEAILFDMDGVIFDSEVKVLECWKEIADKYNIKDIEIMCRKCLGLNREVTKEVFLKRYGQAFPYDMYKGEMAELFHRRYGGGRLPLKPGVVELLQYLKENNKKIALASSTRSELVRRELSDAGLMDYFDVVIGGDMVEKSKPEPDIFIKACEQLGVSRYNAFGVEDSYNGIRALAAGGIKAIMVPDMVEANDEIKGLAEIILPDLFAVKAFLQKNS